MARLRLARIHRGPLSRLRMPGFRLLSAPFLVLVAMALVGMAGRRWF